MRAVCLSVCFLTKHFFCLQHLSCVSEVMGKRSFGFTSLLLPANATQRPGIVPFTHSSFRTHKIWPSQLRAPLHRNWKLFASALQITSGFVIQPGLTRLVHGASCLHSFGLVFERHALGTTRFPPIFL